MSTWFITGCTTGLGRQLAQAVLAAGHNAVITARDATGIADIVDAQPQRALAVALDVTDRAQISAAVDAAIDRFGGIDVLVNNAGYGYRAAVEEGDETGVANQFATNFFGPVNLIKAVLPGMRARRSGTIVNTSSISAQIGPPGSGYYSSSKAALEAISASLQKEVGPLGINVIVIEPGAFRTDFAGRSLQQAPTPIADYADTAGKRRKEHDTVHGTQPGDPAKAAQAILTAVNAPSPPTFLLLGNDALKIVRSTLEARRHEIDTWQELSASTDLGT